MLDLLAVAATRAPVLLIVDDVQWLDRPSATVLSFVARRLKPAPITLLAAGEGLDIAELRLGPLDDPASAALLSACAPELPLTLQRRVLREAAGNPLALIELATAGLDERALLSPWLPLSARLEQAFAGPLERVPPATRTALLAAALDESASLAEVLAAASRVVGEVLTVDVLRPAASERLIDRDAAHPRFSHPLVRSAIRQRASAAERQAIHAAFAELFAGRPERQAWHRAAEVVGTDEAVAADLDAAAALACRRGEPLIALRAGDRAAELSADVAGRCRRTLDAAELARELGLGELLADLLRRAASLDPGPRDAARLTWLRGGLSATDVPAAAAAMNAGGDGAVALKLLATAAEDGFWAGRDGEALLAEALAVAPGADEPRVLSVRAFVDPIGQGATVLEGLSRLDTGGIGGPGLSGRLAGAAAAVGDLELAERLSAVAVAGLREQGRIVPLVRALVVSASTQIQLGRWTRARAEAVEAMQLARETRQPVLEAAAEAACALIAALRGDVDAVESHAAAAERLALATGARGILGEAQLARGLEALGAGRAVEAFEQLWRMFQPGDPAHHRFLSVRAIGYLAEAAARSDHRAAAQELLARLEPLARQTPSPQLQVAVCQARALLAGDDDAERLFRAASASDMPRWSFDWARLQLAYGSWLRSRRRPPTRAHRCGPRGRRSKRSAPAPGRRARKELRATGETSRRRTDENRDELTPQELQIAQLAAEGLPIARSARGSISRTGRSARTCTGSSRSSGSPLEPSCAPRWSPRTSTRGGGLSVSWRGARRASPTLGEGRSVPATRARSSARAAWPRVRRRCRRPTPPAGPRP